MRNYVSEIAIVLLFAMGLAVASQLLSALFSSPAEAASQCGARSFIIDQLAARYGESRTAIGIAANNMVMELFANAESQSWTIAVSDPNGQTCLLASGQGFEALADVLPKQGAPL